MAGAGGHRGGLQDDGVAAGGETNRHLLIKDPTWSLENERKPLVFLPHAAFITREIRLFNLLFSITGLLTIFCMERLPCSVCSWRNKHTKDKKKIVLTRCADFKCPFCPFIC